LNQNRSTWLLTGTKFESWVCRNFLGRMSRRHFEMVHDLFLVKYH